MQDNKNTVIFKVFSLSSKYVLSGEKKKKWTSQCCWIQESKNRLLSTCGDEK